jgi:hypothetical protein
VRGLYDMKERKGASPLVDDFDWLGRRLDAFMILGAETLKPGLFVHS